MHRVCYNHHHTHVTVQVNVCFIPDNAERRQVQHACEVANLAVDIMTCCSDLEIGRNTTAKLCMRIALHSGMYE